jgi:integrase
VELLPRWRARKVKDITRRDMHALVETIAERAPITANRTLALIRKIFNHAIGADWIEANVASLIPKPGSEQSRDRVLNEDEIRTVWAACEPERPATRQAEGGALEPFDFKAHDLRRTAASMMASGGIPRLTISKILNHAESGVTAVYDRHGYDPEKRAALDWWALKLQAILHNNDAGKVLAFVLKHVVTMRMSMRRFTWLTNAEVESPQRGRVQE